MLEIDEEYEQLTAEIYGMKLLELTAKKFVTYIGDGKVEFIRKNLSTNENYRLTTQDLHDHFVREFNKQQP